MDSAVEAHGAVPDAHHEAKHDEHPSDARYWKIAFFLAAVTGAEVVLTYLHIGKAFIPDLTFELQ